MDFEETKRRYEEEQKQIRREVESLICSYQDGDKGKKELDKRFLRDHGCINFVTDDYMHEVKLARVYHYLSMAAYPEEHDCHEEEPYRCYHKTVCKCGFSEACDSSD